MVAMTGSRNSLRSLNMDELAGVVNLCPWYGAARKELCLRMSRMGGSDWGIKEYADAAMYVSSRAKVFEIIRAARKDDYSDKDAGELLKTFIAAAGSNALNDGSESVSEQETVPYRRTIRSSGGDFFSQDEYDNVKRTEDSIFSGFVAERSDESEDRNWEDSELGFCTETLAGIYAEQGYFTEAKKIYSRLILRYPEKSAYFASLIGKTETE